MRSSLLDNDQKLDQESNLGKLDSYLIPKYGLKSIYTMTKKDLDGLHKDHLDRLAPSSFTVN